MKLGKLSPCMIFSQHFARISVERFDALLPTDKLLMLLVNNLQTKTLHNNCANKLYHSFFNKLLFNSCEKQRGDVKM